MLLFYDDVAVLRKEKPFKNYAETYKVETIDNKSLSDSLSLSKNSIKNLFNDLLREKRGFKYILSTKITSKKHINNETKYLKGTNFRGYKFSPNKVLQLGGSKWASFAELIFAVEGFSRNSRNLFLQSVCLE